MSALAAKTSQKRKNQGDGDHPLKEVVNQPVKLGPSDFQGTPNPPRHGVGKGLMTTHGPIINEPVAPTALLVKDKQHTVQTSYSIIKDLDLDECSEHETDALGDSNLFDLMRVSILLVLFVLSCIVMVLIICFLLGFCKDACTPNLMCY